MKQSDERHRRAIDLARVAISQEVAHKFYAGRGKPFSPFFVVRKSQVYVVGFDHYVKIGYSSRRPLRQRELEGFLPVPLTVYAIISADSSFERKLHKRFAPYRLNGEWFKLDGQLADWINAGCPA